MSVKQHLHQRILPALFRETGFLHIQNPAPHIQTYTHLYGLFDDFVYECLSDPSRLLLVEQVAQRASEHKIHSSFFSDIPFGLKDRRGIEGKSSKTYLHLSKFSATHLAQYANQGWATAGNLGVAAVELIDAVEATLAGIMLSADSMFGVDANIVLKILRYEGRDDWGTTPHVDKSALSVVLHGSDDLAGLYVMPPENTQFDIATAHCARIYCDIFGNPLTSVLLPGAFSDRVGLDGIASPHAVCALGGGALRFSVIAFLIPCFPELNSVETDVPILGDFQSGFANLVSTH